MARAVYCRSCVDHPDSLCIVDSEGTHHTRAIDTILNERQEDRDNWLNSTALQAGRIEVDGDFIRIHWSP